MLPVAMTTQGGRLVDTRRRYAVELDRASGSRLGQRNSG